MQAGQIRSVQALRAVAALCVVGFHSSLLLHDWFDQRFRLWENGNAGVDLFFVISGFIMSQSARRLHDGWKRFIVLRFIRIAPMYWIVTVAKLAVVALLPAMALQTRPTPWNIVASFLFVPSRNAAGYVRPILDVGWTLSFEIVFYAAFAAALFSGIAPLAVVAPIMVLLAVLSFGNDPSFPAIATLASPIALEFVFGLIVGRIPASQSGRTLSPARSLSLIGFGFVCLLLVPAQGAWGRVLFWGVPAALLLYGSVAGEWWIGRRLPDVAVKLGEASYSLYLTHGFIIPVVGVAIARAGVRGASGAIVLVSLTLVLASAAALVVYTLIEVPVINRLRRAAGVWQRGTLAAPETAV